MRILFPLALLASVLVFIVWIFGLGWYRKDIQMKPDEHGMIEYTCYVWHNQNIIYSEYEDYVPAENIDSIRNVINVRMDSAIALYKRLNP